MFIRILFLKFHTLFQCTVENECLKQLCVDIKIYEVQFVLKGSFNTRIFICHFYIASIARNLLLLCICNIRRDIHAYDTEIL